MKANLLEPFIPEYTRVLREGNTNVITERENRIPELVKSGGAPTVYRSAPSRHHDRHALDHPRDPVQVAAHLQREYPDLVLLCGPHPEWITRRREDA